MSTSPEIARKGGLVGTGSGTVEGMRSLFCGVLFGLTSPLIGHPLDTIKSKMQAQTDYFKGSATRTLINVVKNEGFFAVCATICDVVATLAQERSLSC
jgi:hypothetical protein